MKTMVKPRPSLTPKHFSVKYAKVFKSFPQFKGIPKMVLVHFLWMSILNAMFLDSEKRPITQIGTNNMKKNKKTLVDFVADTIRNPKLVTGGAAPKHPGNFTGNDHPQHPGNEKQR